MLTLIQISSLNFSLDNNIFPIIFSFFFLNSNFIQVITFFFSKFYDFILILS